jgi:hypothetical protein
MNKNVGASFTLSVLVVAFFAVALYQPDPQTRRASARTTSPVQTRTPPDSKVAVAPPTPEPRVPTAAPIPTAGPRVDPPASASKDAGGSVSQVARHDQQATKPRPTPDRATVTKTISRRSEAVRDPEPRGAFTSVRDGETLADVARRVYGPASDPNTLWMANRDLIARKDAPLRAGMMLRTP